jgi:hypothetical protein
MSEASGDRRGGVGSCAGRRADGERPTLPTEAAQTPSVEGEAGPAGPSRRARGVGAVGCPADQPRRAAGAQPTRPLGAPRAGTLRVSGRRCWAGHVDAGRGHRPRRGTDRRVLVRLGWLRRGVSRNHAQLAPDGGPCSGHHQVVPSVGRSNSGSACALRTMPPTAAAGVCTLATAPPARRSERSPRPAAAPAMKGRPRSARRNVPVHPEQVLGVPP